MQDKTWYSILGLDAEPLFLQDHMLKTVTVNFVVNTVLFDTELCLLRNLLEQSLFLYQFQVHLAIERLCSPFYL